MLKAAIKHASGEDQVRHRTLAPEVVTKWVKKLESLKGEIAAVMQDEKEEKQVRCVRQCRKAVGFDFHKLRRAEMELNKSQNMLEHEKEIFSRPARTWFQSSKEKQKAEGEYRRSLQIRLVY